MQNITDEQKDTEGWKITMTTSMYPSHVHGGAQETKYLTSYE